MYGTKTAKKETKKPDKPAPTPKVRKSNKPLIIKSSEYVNTTDEEITNDD